MKLFSRNKIVKSDLSIIVSLNSIGNGAGSYIDDFVNFNLLNKCDSLDINFLSHTHKKPKSIYNKFNWNFTETSYKNMIFEFIDKLKDSPSIPKWNLFLTDNYAVDCSKILELLNVYFDHQTPVCVCSEVLWDNKNMPNPSYENFIRQFMPKQLHKKHQNWNGVNLLNSHPSGAFAISEKAIIKILSSSNWLNWKKAIREDTALDCNVIVGLLMTSMKISMPNVKFMSEKLNTSEFSFLRPNGKCAVLKVDGIDSKNYETYRSSIANSRNVTLKDNADYSNRVIKSKEIVLKIKLADKESISGSIILHENKKAIFTGKNDWNVYWNMDKPDSVILKNIDDYPIGEIKYGSNKKNCHIMIKDRNQTITTFGTIYE